MGNRIAPLTVTRFLVSSGKRPRSAAVYRSHLLVLEREPLSIQPTDVGRGGASPARGPRPEVGGASAPARYYVGGDRRRGARLAAGSGVSTSKRDLFRFGLTGTSGPRPRTECVPGEEPPMIVTDASELYGSYWANPFGRWS